MKINKYNQIQNLDQLEAAQKQLSRKLHRKQSDVVRRFYGLKDDYSPSNLFGMTVRTTGADAPLIQAIRTLRKFIAKL